MKLKSIATHLRPYIMLARRRTTINHAFASAVAPSDTYDEGRVRDALLLLGIDPDDDLTCAYCGEPAETWDHVFATVQNSRFSGHGHRIGNLLPCCKPCNSRKGNKAWEVHLTGLDLPAATLKERQQWITNYLAAYSVTDPPRAKSDDQARLDEIQRQVLELLGEGDQVATRIRASEPTVSL